MNNEKLDMKEKTFFFFFDQKKSNLTKYKRKKYRNEGKKFLKLNLKITMNVFYFCRCVKCYYKIMYILYIVVIRITEIIQKL